MARTFRTAASAGLATAMSLGAVGLGAIGLSGAARADTTPDPMTADPRGFYATLGLGASWPQAFDVSSDRLGPKLPIEGTLRPEPGFASELGLGYDFGALRGELTWVHRQTAISSSSWTVGPYKVDASSDNPQAYSNSGFASLYLDLPIKNSRLVPYLGGGLGVTATTAGATTLRLRRATASFGGASSSQFGYQAKAGLAYRSSPRTDLFAEATYQGTPGFSQESLDRSSQNSWGFRLGLRYRLGGSR